MVDAAYHRAWYRKNRARVLAQRARPAAVAAQAARHQARKAADPIGHLIKAKRNQCAQRGEPFGLRPGDVDDTPACPCCGEPWADTPLRQRTLDRLLPDRGYVPGNVYVLCGQCNRRKQDSTIKTLDELSKYIRTRLARALGRE